MKRKKQRTLELSKPGAGAGAQYKEQQEKKVVKIKPFKANRDLINYPVRKGQGVTINGWQFEVKAIRPNGMLYLRPIGRITEDLTAPGPVQEALSGALKKEEQAGDKQNNDKKL